MEMSANWIPDVYIVAFVLSEGRGQAGRAEDSFGTRARIIFYVMLGQIKSKRQAAERTPFFSSD